MDNNKLNKIISSAFMAGEITAMSLIIPQTTYIRKSDLLVWLKTQGYNERTLKRWIDSGWLNPRQKGERSATKYLRSEIAQCLVKESLVDIVI